MMFSAWMPYFPVSRSCGALGDFEFALTRKGLRLHRVFVDAADDQRRAVGARQRAHALEFLLAVFEVDRIDDAFALAIGERELDGARDRWCRS